MIHVILDAEPLKRDPSLSKGPFRALSKLIEAEKIRIYIPEVAKNEFLTNQQERVREKTEKASLAIKHLSKLPLAINDLKVLNEFVGRLEKISSSVDKNILASFDYWCDQNKITIQQVGPDHAQKVLESYFSGKPPFRTLKARDDFPDAFIWAAVSDIAKLEKEVAFITADNKFRETCRLCPANLKLYKSIEELLHKTGLGDYLKQGVLEAQLEKILSVFHNELISGDKATELMIEGIINRKIAVHYPVEGAFAIKKVEDIKRSLLSGLVTYYGDGLLSVGFSAVAQCELTFDTTSDLAKNIPTKKVKHIRQHDEHTCEIALTRSLVFSGLLIIELPKKLIEDESTADDARRQVLSSEFVMDSLSLFSEVSNDNNNYEELSCLVIKHAKMEAKYQINMNDLDAEIELDEESDRLERRAQWFDVPDELCKNYGEINIKKGARLKIAPLPRFEQLVKMEKEKLLKEKASMDE